MGLAVAIGPCGSCLLCPLNAVNKYPAEPLGVLSPDGLKVGKGRLIRKLEL